MKQPWLVADCLLSGNAQATGVASAPSMPEPTES
jgi:hypothetical protein